MPEVGERGLESSKPSVRQRILLVLAIGFAIAGITRFWQVKSQASNATKTVTVPPIKTVTALGRLEPKGQVIKLSAPASIEGNRVETLLVREGFKVKAGQAIAILDSRTRLQAAFQEAQEAVKVAQLNLAKVQAGAKEGEIEAQKAEIARIQAQILGDEREQRETVARLEAQLQGELAAQQATILRLEAELKNAQAEFRRYQQLYAEGAISQSIFDSKRLSLDTTTQQLREAKADLNRINSTGSKQINEANTVLARINATGNKQLQSAVATLDRIAEVRPIDVQTAKAEVDRAIAAAKQAKANLEQAFVRSPQDGVVLDIHTRSGEMVSENGIVEIGQTNQMYAVVEVYQSDVRKVRPQQQVRISSNSLPGELYGRVDWIGWKVQRQDIINADPSENIDSRVVEVYVRLAEASSLKAAKFTNLQVKAVISL